MSCMWGVRIHAERTASIIENFTSLEGEEYILTLKLSNINHHLKISLKWRESIDQFVTFTLYTDRNSYIKSKFCGGCPKICVCFENLSNHISDMTLIISVIQCRNSIGHVDEHPQLPATCTNHEAEVEKVNKGFANHERLSGDMKNLLVTGKGSDIVLTNGKEEIPAHKLVLSLRSPVFAKMLEHEMRENIEKKITIKDITFEVLKKLIGFLYSGEIIFDDTETAIQLYIAADKYDVDDLKAASSNALMMNIDTHYVFEIIEIADLYQDRSLKDSAINFIVQHYAEVKSSELWGTFLSENQKLAVEVLSCIVDRRHGE